jgi:WD40 repeat protein
MSIQATCPCGKSFLTNDTYAGKLVRCPGCGQPLRIPNPQQAMEVTSFEEDDDDGAAYGMAPEDPTLPPIRPGMSSEPLSVSGEIGCHHLSTHDEVISRVAVSADSTAALATIDDTIYLLNLRAGKQFSRLRGHESEVVSVALSPDASLAISADDHNRMLLWDVPARRALLRLQGHSMRVHDLTFAPEGTQAVSVSADGLALWWDVSSGQQLGGLRVGEALTRAVFSPDGKSLATGTDSGRVLLWDRATGELRQELKNPPDGPIEALAFGRDGQRILAAAILRGRAAWCFWDYTREKRRYRKAGGAGPVKCHALAFCPDGERLLCGGGPICEKSREDPDVEIWSTPVYVLRTGSGSESRRFPGHMKKRPGLGMQLLKGELANLANVHCVAVSADGTRGLSGGDDGRVEVWGLG